MRKIKVFLMAFAVLFLLISAVNASEAADISDSFMTNDSHFNGENGVLSSDADENAYAGMDTDNDIPSSNNEALSSEEDSQPLEAEKEFEGTSFSSLQSEINSCDVNDTIILKSNISQDGSSLISIDKPITIDGNGHAIDALNSSGIFFIQADATLKNIIFKNSYYGYGAVYSLSNVHLVNCTFIDNTGLVSSAVSSGGDCTLDYCIFINNTVQNAQGGAVVCANNNFSISECEFYNNRGNNGSALYCINSSGTIEFSKFIGNKAVNNGGAVYLNSSNVTVNYASFYNNSASLYGGAIYSFDSICNIDTGIFTNNTASNGGAAYIENSTLLIENGNFDDNTANANAGALFLNNSNSTIDYSYFEYNAAGEKGAAIYLSSPLNNTLCSISSSQFLNNKAKSYNLTVNESQGRLNLKFMGWNNYINAIYSESEIDFSNVVYWNGNISNTDDEYDISSASGQNITLEIYDSQNALLQNTTFVTNAYGEQYVDIYDLADGNYKYKAYHNNDSYYSYVQAAGNFTLNIPASSISLNIEDYAEFQYNNCSISFDIENRTSVRYVISNEDESLIYVNATVDKYSQTITVNLGVRDGYYKISVYNLGSGLYRESHDSKLFNISQADSRVSINPIADTPYGEIINVEIVAENKNRFNITICYENQSVAYNIITRNDTVAIPLLPAGTYTITAVNIGSGNTKESTASSTFNIIKADNLVSISASNVTYGNQTLVSISAHGDGTYVLNINGSTWNIPVMGHTGKILLSLPAGEYSATATFDDENYDTVVTGTVFNVSKAENIVTISASNVTYGENTIISISAQADGVYSLDVNGTSYNVTVKDGTGRIPVSFSVGEYEVKGTFDDPNYESFISNATFNVSKADNIVTVSANNVSEGENTTIIISAHADGVYCLDVSGTPYNVTVEGGKGVLELALPLGEHYANASFNNTNYNTFISNCTFAVMKDSNLTVDFNGDIIDGYDIVFNVFVSDDATGSVAVQFNEGNYSSTIGNGTAVISISNAKPGRYVASITYSGDENHASKTIYAMLRVKNVYVYMYDTTYGWSNSINHQAKLLDEDGKGIPDKEVLFSINGESIKSYTNNDGVASINLSLKIGQYDIDLSCQYGNVSRKITVVSRFSSNKNINMYYFDGSKYSFKVYGDNGKLVGANQVVALTLNKKTYNVKTNKNGVASFVIPKTVKPGTYAITATYKGQTIKNTIKVKKILSSKKVYKVKKTAKKLVLKAKLKKKLKGKKITFKFKGKKYTAKTNKKGIAKVTIKKKVIKKLKKGKTYKVKISYFKTSLKVKVKVK